MISHRTVQYLWPGVLLRFDSDGKMGELFTKWILMSSDVSKFSGKFKSLLKELEPIPFDFAIFKYVGDQLYFYYLCGITKQFYVLVFNC